MLLLRYVFFIYYCNELFVAERSFSALNKIKSYLSLTTDAERLNITAVLHVDSKMLCTINYGGIIDEFASKNVRCKTLWTMLFKKKMYLYYL